MFPAYLLTDTSFWLFTALYVLSVWVTVWAIAALFRKFSVAPKITAYLPLWVLLLFSYLLVEQFFHQAEHVTQMYQFGFLGMSSSASHGFVWFLDDEWNHFTFNGLYLTGLAVVMSMLVRTLKKAGIRQTVSNVALIYGFLVLEGWHMVEHTYRITQHVQGLCDQCAGILDPLTGINRLLIHFWFNFFALILPSAVFVWYGIGSELRSRIRQTCARESSVHSSAAPA